MTFAENEKVEIDVTLSSKAKGNPSGTVRLFREDKKSDVEVGKVKLRGKKNEDIVFDLGRLKAGKDSFFVLYDGD